MDTPTNQPARVISRVPLRIVLAVVIVGLSLIDLLVSAQAWVIAADIGIIFIAIAFAIGRSWARRVLGIVLVVAAIGYGFSAINGGGMFEITNALIWTALFLSVWYLNGELSWKRPRALS
jgi:hypothetical protein